MAATHVITNVFISHCITLVGWCQYCDKICGLWNQYKCHFCKVRKVKFGPLLSIRANTRKQHIIWSHIWSFRWPHDLWPWIILKGQIKVILNGACYETSIGNHIWPFSLSADLGIWKTLKRINQDHQNFNGLYLIMLPSLTKFIWNICR